MSSPQAAQGADPKKSQPTPTPKSGVSPQKSDANGSPSTKMGGFGSPSSQPAGGPNGRAGPEGSAGPNGFNGPSGSADPYGPAGPGAGPAGPGAGPAGAKGGATGGGLAGGIGAPATGGLGGSPGAGGAGNTSMYNSSDDKKSYARKVKPGEKPETQAPANVQKATDPLQHADWMSQNQNLPAEPPQMAMAAPAQDVFIANFDHCTFANDVVRRRRSMGSRRSSQMGSMGGSQMGSMYGMGGGMGGGSMYGMNPMMGSMYSRPASLFGSMGGPMMMGSMYGMNPMMGSMYGMGGPMMGSMYGPYGSMGGGGGSMYGGSMYGMNSGYGSFASSGMPGSGYGSAYNAGSNMGNQSAGAGYSAYGMNNPNSMYGANGGSMYGQNAGAPSSMYGQTPSAAAGSGAAPNASRGLSVTPSAMVAATPAGGAGGNSRQTEPVASVLVLTQPKGPATINQTGPNAVTVAGKPSTFGQVLPGQDPAALVTAWRGGESYKTFAQNVAAGHNAALLVASGSTPEEQAPALALIRAAMTDAVARLDASARSDPANGYYDGQFFCCALYSPDKGVDLTAGNPNAPPTDIVIGSNPIFGPGFMNVPPKAFKSVQEFQSLVSTAMTVVPQAGAKAPEKPVVVFELVLKQVRASAANANGPDVLVSSVLIFYNSNTTGQKGYFTVFRNDQAIPPSLVKNAVGGACRTSAILCLSSSADPATAQAAVASLTEASQMMNSPPRSGNVARFVAFARGESDKLKQRKDADPAVLNKVESMLADNEKLAQNPRQEQPKPYPINPRSRQNSFNATPSAAANSRAAPAGPAPAGTGATGASRGVGPAPGPSENAPAASRAAPAASRSAPAPAAAAAAGGGSAPPANSGSDNVVKLTLVASPQAANPGAPETWSMGPDGKTITAASGPSCTVDEVVVRTPDDWRSGSASEQVSQLQSMFQDGNNTAIIGTTSMNDPNSLDKQPLWMSYKRMISSLLSVATQKYVFAEVSLSVTLVSGNELIADLLQGAEQEGETAAAQSPTPLTVAVSPLFGPTVYKSATIKPPTPLQLESTVNNALHQVPLYMQKAPNSQNAIIFACAILKGVTSDDVFTSSLVAASATNPQVFVDVMDKKPGTPFELFDYALRGPCCTLFLGDLIQGDQNVAEIVNLMTRLRASPNRSVRSCSVRKFVAFAEDSLRKSDDKAAKATSETEKAHILKSKKSMEVFYNEYKLLLEDPQNRDPKTYRKSGSGGHSSSGGGRGEGDSTSVGSRGSSKKSTTPSTTSKDKNAKKATTPKETKKTPSSTSKDKDKDKKKSK